MAELLTTLAAAKAWVGIDASNTASDPQLTTLIGAVSRAVRGIMNRPSLFLHTVTERQDGSGSTRMLLREWPVLSIQSLSIDGISIAASGTYPLNGYLLEPGSGPPPGRMQALDLFGCSVFGCGRQNVAVVYPAGYAVLSEPQTVASGVVTVAAPYGPWGNDEGVALASNGTALVKVAGTPAAGQYQLNATTPGKYNFNAANEGNAVQISYSYVPDDVFQITTELVGERWKYKTHIGEVSKTLGGQETVSFSQKDIPATMRMMLQNYINVVPL